MKTYVIDLFAQQLVVQVDDNGAGQITSGLNRETCPSCGLPDCCFSCDGSQSGEYEDTAAGRLAFNGLVDGIESLVLAHACAGIDVSEPRYVEGIKTTLNAAANNS